MDILTPGLGTGKAVSFPLTRQERCTSTKQKLVLAAIHLGAKHGFSNIPLRGIVEMSGSRNISAIQYHYKDREGLLTAIMDAIDAAWPSDLPSHALGNVRTILAYFLLNLETLKQADDRWHDDVVRFLARLCAEESANGREAAAALLASRLSRILGALQPLCPGVPAEVLRLHVSNACLLLVTISANLSQCYLKALGCGVANTDVVERFSRAVDMAAGIICSDWTTPPNEDVPGIVMSLPNTQVTSPGS